MPSLVFPRASRRPVKSSELLRRERGVALIIVLAFVVLLTGLMLAFFSRAAVDRQISNSSAGQTRVDGFANSSIDVLIGDLKEEIRAGSDQDAKYTVNTSRCIRRSRSGRVRPRPIRA